MSDDESFASDASASCELEDLDSDSDADSDSERGIVTTFKLAIEVLQATPPVPGFRLKFPSRDAEPDRGLWFPRFISALQRHETITGIKFVKTRFNEDEGREPPQVADDKNDEDDDDEDDGIDDMDDDGALSSEEMDRLFGTVLPNHPTLKAVHFDECSLPHRYVELLMSPLAGPTAVSDDGGPKWGLVFYETQLDLPSIEAISNALRRSAIRTLALFDTGMTSPKCRLITGAAAECDGLDNLTLVERPQTGGTWIIDEGAFAPGSISKVFVNERLWFGGTSWTDGGAAEFFGQLRTNYRQTNASFSNLSVDQTRYPVELLSRYNFTLRELHAPLALEWLPTFQMAVWSSQLARAVHVHIGPANYHVALRALWPLVLQDVSSYPALVYRFLRRGNVAALADQLRPAESANPATAIRNGST